MRARNFLWVLLLVMFTLRVGAWTQEVYVWQRQGSLAQAQALEQAKALVDGYYFLGAEVAWSGGKPEVVRPTLDYAKLAKLGHPVGLVLRVGAYPGPFKADDAAAKALTSLAASLLAEARAGELEPSELQIDFDCAEAKLDGYRVWLGALKQAAGKTPLVFTALPVWLKHEAEFTALAKAADGFVLQVHSLEKPTGPEAAFTLCDPAQARAWAAQAGKVGVPFRLALSTYGYLVAFDPKGKFIGLAAEGRPPEWPTGTIVRAVRSDAIALAQLEQELAKTPPPHCTGIIWFRLPVAGDKLNWDFATFATVIKGKVPVSKFTLAVEWPEPGLAEISIVNSGDTTEPPPARAEVHWDAATPPVASDGLGGFQLNLKNLEGLGIILNETMAPEVSLAPGARLKIAWLRFAHEISLSAKIIPPP